MSLRNKLAAGVFAVSAFAVAGFAQDAKPEAKEVTKDGSAKIERRADRFGARGKRGGMHGGLFGGHMAGMGRGGLFGIELTDDQKARIKQILTDNKPDQAVLVEAKNIMRAKFEGKATPEQEARLQVLKAQSKEKAQAVHAQIKAVLTPEQTAQIEQKKQEMKGRMHEMRQRIQERRQQRKADKPATTPADVKKDN